MDELDVCRAGLIPSEQSFEHFYQGVLTWHFYQGVLTWQCSQSHRAKPLQVHQACSGPYCLSVCMQLGIIPFAGVDIAAFEIFKEQLLFRYHGDPPPMAILGAGMMSSSIAQFVSYPLALVRTRLQVRAASQRCLSCLLP